MKRKAEYTFLFYAKILFLPFCYRHHPKRVSDTLCFSVSLQAMELFWELTLTVAISLLLPLILIKLVSMAPNHDPNVKVAISERDLGVQSDIQEWKTEEAVRFAGRVDEFRGESILGKLIVPEILEVSCGSPKIHNAEKIGQRRIYREIEVVDLTEKPIEKTSRDYGLICECQRNLGTDESSQVTEISEVEIESLGFESSENKVEEIKISQRDSDIDEFSEENNVEVENRGLLDEDEWEGIERTELERLFGAAVVFVGSKSNTSRIASLNNDVKMQLYGFHKIATQGPCQEPQPMALKFSARAKWNAWQQLGMMSPELAMERYITILSESIPDWMSDHPNENGKSVYADIQGFEILPLELKL